jgi:hypothetical protein
MKEFPKGSTWRCRDCHNAWSRERDAKRRAKPYMREIRERKAVKRQAERDARREEYRKMMRNVPKQPKPKQPMTVEQRDKLNEYKRIRYKEDVQYRLSQIMRGRLRVALRAQRTTKRSKTMGLLGCTLEELKAYIEQRFLEGMTWENHGSVWHIDHIRPMASYDLADEAQLREAMHYSNLQPLYACENVRKSSVWDGRRWRVTH